MIEALTAQQADRAEQIEALWEMTLEERVAAIYRGGLTPVQLLEWAAHRPHEIPLIDGEFAFIAAHTPEVAEVYESGD